MAEDRVFSPTLDSESIGSIIVLDQLGALPFPSSSIKVSWTNIEAPC